jgi:hydroxymethylbilane synthase
MNELKVGTRGSKLALVQTESVVEMLRNIYPHIRFSIHVIRTTGDKVSDLPLQRLKGKGFFVKEIETALLDGRIDIAVHSMKDMPTSIVDGLTIAAVCMRLDPRDALVLRGEGEDGYVREEASLSIIPNGAVVGTSSLRRKAQLLHLRPDLVIKHLRGNVDTRLRKLDEGQFDAIIVAAAALERLNLKHRITALLPIHVCTPAAGQGALAVEARSDDKRTLELIKPLDDERARAEVEAERALIAALGAGCHVPVGACARCINDDELEMTAVVASTDGKVVLRRTMRGSLRSARELGEKLAEKLIADGADQIISG